MLHIDSSHPLNERRHLLYRFISAALVWAALFGLTGCQSDDDTVANPPATTAVKTDSDRERIAQLVDSEQRILDLEPFISQIGDYLAASDPVNRRDLDKIFLDQVQYTPIETPPEMAMTVYSPRTHLAVHPITWPVGDSTSIDDASFLDQLWAPLRATHRFTDTQFGIESGNFKEANQYFEMETSFEGRLSSLTGKLALTTGVLTWTSGIKATQTIGWRKTNGVWYIDSWKQTSFSMLQSTKPLFEDVTQQAISNPATLKSVQRSSQEELLNQRIESKTIMRPVHDGFSCFDDWEGGSQYPSVSVVDFDGDGDDDIFLTDRVLPGIMLRNDDGQFTDVTDSIGLKVPGQTHCALFADFDNDGDSDLLVGRSIGQSMFFVNDDGRFRRDASMDKELEFVRFVVSGTVFDINNDGLLDVYLSTYVTGENLADLTWVDSLIRPQDRQHLLTVAKQHPWLNRGGPANVVLMNVDGRLRRIEAGEELQQFRNTYQSTTADWDQDGDLDLYLSNDFSPDVFLRNDTTAGSPAPVFVSVGEKIAADAGMSFSMGSSWGDFDNDGDLDLYVSNMYSKAGRRIIETAGKVDPRSDSGSRGNFLYRNDGGTFRQIAGADKDAQHVAKVGWSFGGQFADFDNDRRLDLYVPSGFFTAPKKVRSNRDL